MRACRCVNVSAVYVRVCERMHVWICSYLSCKSDFVFPNGISSQHLELRLAVCCVLCTVVVGGCGQGFISDLNNPPTRRSWMLRLQRTCKNTHTRGFLPACIFSLRCHFSRTPNTNFWLSKDGFHEGIQSEKVKAEL